MKTLQFLFLSWILALPVCLTAQEGQNKQEEPIQQEEPARSVPKSVQDLRSSDKAVQLKAIGELTRSGQKVSTIASALVEALQSPHDDVKRAAKSALDAMKKDAEATLKKIKTATSGGKEQEPAAVNYQRIRFDVHFPGGTLKSLIQMVAEKNQISPNVIMTPKAEQWVIPSFTVKSVTLRDLMRALHEIDKRLEVQDAGEIFIFRDPFISSAPKKSRVYMVEKFLKKHKIEDVVTAVETAWKMINPEPTAALKYHTDTRLLFCVGTDQELAAIDQVLGELSKSTVEEKK